jgi:hypothetical protein
MSYPDNFNRADGALGSAWSVFSGAASIVSGMAHATGTTVVLANGQSESGTQDHYIVVPVASGSVPETGILLRRSSSDGMCLYAIVYSSGSNLIVQVGLRSNGANLPGSYGSVATAGRTSVTLRATGAGSVVTAYLDGTQIVTQDISGYTLGTGFGFRFDSAGGNIDAFDAAGGASPTMVVTPDPLWIGGGLAQMVATGTGTDWTIGVPGSSTLTVDHGDISYQYTIDSTHIRFTYLPGLWAGAITFTESQYGATAQINVTVTPPSTYPGGLALSPTAIAYIERSAVAETSPTIANREMVVASSVSDASMLSTLGSVRSSVADYTHTESSEPAVSKLVYLLWQIVNGVNAPPTAPLTTPSDTTVKADLDTLKAALADLITSNNWTLGDVITQVTGSGVPTIKDVMDAIGGLSAPDLSTITSAISALRGDTSSTVKAVEDSLAAARTNSNLTLGDITSRLDFLGATSATPTALAVAAFLIALLAAPETGGASVAVVAAAVGAGPILDIATIVELVGVAGEIASLISQIIEWKNSLAAAYVGPPTWPSDGEVTWGTSVALSDGLVVTGPMDGVRVTITSHPNHAGQYAFGDRISYTHVGAIAFISGNGDAEHPESIGLDAQIITPRTMQQAASAVIRLNGGFGGTVKPWAKTV